MSMVINTNNTSNNAVRLLDKTARSQATTMERLTSGLRINSSKDDAAGLSVATAMTKQIRGLDMAIRNANDGLSLVQTLDAATEEVTNMMQRMRDLGIQAMNKTYTSAQRADMNVEYSQLGAEIKRIASTTKFNGISIFHNAKMQSMSIHVGWENGSTNKIGSNQLKLSVSLIAMAGSILNQNVKSAGAASKAVSVLNAKLSQVQKARATWGAIMNRLDYTINNLQTVQTNTQSSRSRIQDTDYAKESANLARTQVLNQAGMAMLSQSNQSSQNILSLLR